MLPLVSIGKAGIPADRCCHRAAAKPGGGIPATRDGRPLEQAGRPSRSRCGLARIRCGLARIRCGFARIRCGPARAPAAASGVRCGLARSRRRGRIRWPPAHRRPGRPGGSGGRAARAERNPGLLPGTDARAPGNADDHRMAAARNRRPGPCAHRPSRGTGRQEDLARIRRGCRARALGIHRASRETFRSCTRPTDRDDLFDNIPRNASRQISNLTAFASLGGGIACLRR